MLAWYLKFTNSSFANCKLTRNFAFHVQTLQKYVVPLSNICHQVLLFKRNVVTAELRHNEMNTSCTKRTVQSAKTYAMTYLLTFTRAVLSAILCHATHKSINLELQLRRTLSSHVKKATLLETLKKPRY